MHLSMLRRRRGMPGIGGVLRIRRLCPASPPLLPLCGLTLIGALNDSEMKVDIERYRNSFQIIIK